MLEAEEYMDIKVLAGQGYSIRAIAAASGYSRNTVRKVLRNKIPQPFSKPAKSSLLDPYKDYCKKRYEECGLSAVRMLQEIVPMGYRGSVWTVRRYLISLEPHLKALQRRTVRFETPPGWQGQADWAYCGRFSGPDGKRIRIYFFVMVLSFSRMMFIKFTTSMKLPVLIECHLEAFRYFGGWPTSILYDNMKQVKLNLHQWNPLFLDFAHYYGIVPKTHRARRPRTKGKVERMAHYVKDNFLNGRSFSDFEDLDTQARHWLDHIANIRIHATTGERPVDLWPKEGLIPVKSIIPYRIPQRIPRKVNSESFVYFARSRYSVPPEHVGKTVFVEQQGQKIFIRCADLIIAEHQAASQEGSYIADPRHIEELWKVSLQRLSRPAPHWQIRFDQSVDKPSLAIYEEIER